MPVTLDAELAVVGAVGAGEPNFVLNCERRGEGGGGSEGDDEDGNALGFHIEKIDGLLR